MKRRSNTFTKGSGCYKCRCCGRMTRDDGCGDSVNVGLCTECYEMGGIENSICDGQYETEEEKAEWIEEIKQLAKIIIERGGVPDSEYL